MGVRVYSIEGLKPREPKVGVIFTGAEQGMKRQITFRHKDGSVFPRRRKLVKKMIMEAILKSLSSLFFSSGSGSLKCQIPCTINDRIKGSDVFTTNDQSFIKRL